MNILIIDGHPDPDPNRFCHALADRYQAGAEGGGHVTKLVRIAALDIPVLRSAQSWRSPEAPSVELKVVQDAITEADHLVIIYPMWLGAIPAYFKAFLEQVARPGFAVDKKMGGLLHGKSARVIVTMGMPAPVYRWYFWAHSLKNLRRNILQFVGIEPVRETIIGSVETTNHKRWLEKIESLGMHGA